MHARQIRTTQTDCQFSNFILPISAFLHKSDEETKNQYHFDYELRVIYTLDGFFNMILWTKPGVGYICIEPWNGILDRTYTDQNFKTKEGIQQVAAGSTYIRTHSIEIL